MSRYSKKLTIFFSILFLLFCYVIGTISNPHSFTSKLWDTKTANEDIASFFIDPRESLVTLIGSRLEYDDKKSDWHYSSHLVNHYVITEKSENLSKIFALSQKSNGATLEFRDVKFSDDNIFGSIKIIFAVKNLSAEEIVFLKKFGAIKDNFFSYNFYFNNSDPKFLITKTTRFLCDQKSCQDYQNKASKLSEYSYFFMTEEKPTMSRKIFQITTTPFAIIGDSAIGVYSIISLLFFWPFM